MRMIAQARMNLIVQFLRFGVAGGIAVAVLFVVLIALVELAGIPETPASAIGFACAVPVNYMLQHRFVFRQAGRHVDCFPRYIGVTLATAVLNTMLFWTLSEMIGLYYVIAQVVTIVVVAVVSFVANRYYTFVPVRSPARVRS